MTGHGLERQVTATKRAQAFGDSDIESPWAVKDCGEDRERMVLSRKEQMEQPRGSYSVMRRRIKGMRLHGRA